MKKKMKFGSAALLIGFALLCAPLRAQDLPAPVSNTAQIGSHFEAVWTNSMWPRLIPPGAGQQRVDIGPLPYTAALDTNFLATLTGSTNSGVNEFIITAQEETNSPPGHVRLWFNNLGVCVYTSAIAYTVTGWITTNYGALPSYYSGDPTNAAQWTADRSPQRILAALTLIATNDVAAYISNLVNSASTGYDPTGAVVSLLVLYSNDIAIVGSRAGNPIGLYLHAPPAHTNLGVFSATDLATANWQQRTTVPHSTDPVLFQALEPTGGGTSNVWNSFALGSMADSDGDGIPNAAELLVTKTDPNNTDSDGDGLSDGAEQRQYNTNPNHIDSDGDGVPDSVEIGADCGTSPNTADSFNDFQLAHLLQLDAIKVAVTSSFTDVWVNTSDNVPVAELLDNGLVGFSGSGPRTRAPCEIGTNEPRLDAEAQYTSLEARPSFTASQRVLRVHLDHYDITPGVTTNGVITRVDLEGARVIGSPNWNNNHDSTPASGPTVGTNTVADHVTWSADIAYDTTKTTYTDGGWNHLDITYKPRLPTLTVSPTPKFVGVNTTAITFTASCTNLTFDGPIWWEITPKVTGGPTIIGGTIPITRSTNETVQLNAGTVPGVYVLTAQPSGIASMGGAATVTVVKLTITEPDGLAIQFSTAGEAYFRVNPACFEWQYVHPSNAVVPYAQTIQGNIEPASLSASPFWTVDNGTISNATTLSPTFSAHNMAVPATRTDVALTFMLTNPFSISEGPRTIEVYRDHLERDYQNFGVGIPCGTAGMPAEPWFFSKHGILILIPSIWNCFGSVWHAYDGTHGGYTEGELPSAGFIISTNDAPIVWTNALADLKRGDYVVFFSHDGNRQHAHTCLSDAAQMYGANNEPNLVLIRTGATSRTIMATWKWHLTSSQTYFDKVNSRYAFYTGSTNLFLNRVVVYRKQ